MNRTHRYSRPRLASTLVALCVGLGGAACTEANPASTSDPAPADGTGNTEAVIDGKFRVGKHRLYLNCRGSGSPTVVYMHGSIVEESVIAHANGIPIQELLEEDVRVCLYDRRNVGLSDTVDAVQTPRAAMRDMTRLLKKARVEPPYVLLGASFGGLLAYVYANVHRDDVVGMVLLDSMFPDEMRLERLFPPDERYRAFSVEDERFSLERISHYKVQRAAQRFVGSEPTIPVTYFSSIPEGFDVNDYGVPEYDRRILRLQERFVKRFEPGTWVRVDAPHFMEPAIPDEIADAVRNVVADSVD